MIKDLKKKSLIDLITFGIVFIISVGFVTLFVVVLIFSISYLFRKRSKINDIRTFDYQYLKYDPKINETAVGFVTILEELRNEDYMSYQDVTSGAHILISNFGSQEFECTGSCYCEEEDQRKRSISHRIIARSLTYLLVSVSSLVAIQKAKDYFEEQCKTDNTLETKCPTSSIKSSIDDCKPIIDPISGFQPGIAGYHHVKQNKIEGTKIGKYWCEGNCVSLNYKNSNHRKKELSDSKNFDCERLQKSGPISVDITDFTPCELSSGSMDTLIHAKFRAEVLGPYCKKLSLVDWKYKYFDDRKQEVVKTRNIPLCSSSNNGFNPSINCVAKKVIIQDLQIMDSFEPCQEAKIF